MSKSRLRWVLSAGLAVAAGGSALAQPAARAKARPKQAPLDVAKHAAVLAGAEVEAAAQAAELLGASDDPAAHEALLDALALGLPAVVAIPALGAVARHPAPIDVLALRRYATHQNVRVRSAAIGALALYPDDLARQAVIAGLHDPAAVVRDAAADAAGRGRNRPAIDTLFKLLAGGEASSARALAVLADVDLARRIADQLGKVPEASLALSLGAILRRTDFGPDPERVELVRAIAKIADPAAVTVLVEYLEATPKNPPRPSRQEAQGVVEARSGGGK